MPPQTTNKFYKYTVNGLPYYEALPDYGNVPSGYTSITGQEYLSGLNEMINRQSQWLSNPQLASSAQKEIDQYKALLSKYTPLVQPNPTATGAGESGVIMNPETGKPQLLSQYQSDLTNPIKTMAPVQQVQQGQAVAAQLGQQYAPQLNIPTTIGGEAMNFSGTRDSIIQQATANQPQVRDIPTIVSNLGPGSQGAEVTALQKWLAGLAGPNFPKAQALADAFRNGTPYGYYGDLTRAAVAEWQAAQKMVVPSGQEGYFGPKSREAMSKLSSEVQTSGTVDGEKLPDGQAGVDAANSALVKAGGIPFNIISDGDISSNDIAAFLKRELIAQDEYRNKIDTLTKELADVMRGATETSLGIKHQAISGVLIGRQLKAYEDQIKPTLAAYEAQISGIEKALGFSKDTLSTILTSAKYMSDISKPEIQTVEGEIWERSANGTWRKVGGPGKASSGSSFLSGMGSSPLIGVAANLLSGFKSKFSQEAFMQRAYDIAASGDDQQLAEYVFSTAISNMDSGDQQKLATTRYEILGQLKYIEDVLASGKIDTGLLTGTYEDIAQKFGRSSDPTLAAFGVAIKETFDGLSRLRTGAALTSNEENFYQSVLPGKNKSPVLNQALINGLRGAMSAGLKTSLQFQLTSSGYDAVAPYLGFMNADSLYGGSSRVNTANPDAASVQSIITDVSPSSSSQSASSPAQNMSVAPNTTSSGWLKSAYQSLVGWFNEEI